MPGWDYAVTMVSIIAKEQTFSMSMGLVGKIVVIKMFPRPQAVIPYFSQAMIVIKAADKSMWNSRQAGHGNAQPMAPGLTAAKDQMLTVTILDL